jgi:uncharacterized cupin superfamily protein
MPTTTLLRRRTEMRREPLENCHGGTGALDWTDVVGPGELGGRFVHFIHDDVLPPGASIGEHRHADTEEFYYVLSGSGMMTLDGVTSPIAAGDVAAVFPGGSHALANTGTVDLRLIVLCGGPRKAEPRAT